LRAAVSYQDKAVAGRSGASGRVEAHGLTRSSTAPTKDDALSHNLQGQRLGRKGRDTRARILAASGRLLAVPDAVVTLSAIAREADLRVASLYVYFSDLPELLGAVLEPVMASAEKTYVAELDAHWADAELAARCLGFVRAYHGFWARHTRILHLRNALADQGDLRMWGYRLRGSQRLTPLLVRQMEADPDAPSSSARYLASSLLIGLERMSTTTTDPQFPEFAAAGPSRARDAGADAQTAGLIAAEGKIFELAIAHERALSRRTSG
jgi:AcrR family transcriptional regulator